MLQLMDSYPSNRVRVAHMVPTVSDSSGFGNFMQNLLQQFQNNPAASQIVGQGALAYYAPGAASMGMGATAGQAGQAGQILSMLGMGSNQQQNYQSQEDNTMKYMLIGGGVLLAAVVLLKK